jgi:hypothetical protein
MWSKCLLFGVAAITYDPLARIDLSMHPPGEPKSLWAQLEPSQKASLRRVVYEMKGGDTIYVKEGPKIIDRGVVQGQIGDRAYRFDSQFRIVDPYRTPWAHQVPVKWSSDFSPVDILVGRSQQFTVEPLSTLDIKRLESAIEVATGTLIGIESNGELRRDALIEEAYYRETQARSKFIVRYHNKLSNEFCNRLERRHAIVPRQEQQWVDIRFEQANHTMLTELKTCFGVGTRKAIREALGQLLEYNHYPSRETCKQWFIVLDEEPSDDDKRYIEILRKLRSLPLTIGWRTKKGFDFCPAWPA